jgi:hypothetical protein
VGGCQARQAVVLGPQPLDVYVREISRCWSRQSELLAEQGTISSCKQCFWDPNH